MTTATANAEGQEDRTGTEVDTEVGTPTENVLTGQGGDENQEPSELEDAMLAGWNRANGKTADLQSKQGDANANNQNTNATGKQADGEGADGGGEGEGDPNAEAGSTQQPIVEDPEIPGLGMKASEVKAQLARVATLEKSNASIAGSLGHLKQVVQTAGQGKKVTAEQLSRVSEEFGADFASALADDLNTAGFGGGAPVDAATIQQMVGEQVQAARVATEREFEKKLVLRAHPDADDHFARQRLDQNGQPVMQKDANGQDVPVWDAGPKHSAFMAFVQTLPTARQEELFGARGWDSSVVTKALDDFKAHEKKVANQQTTQTKRIERATVPQGRGGEAVQPAVDPVLQGWNNVRGRRAVGPTGAGSPRAIDPVSNLKEHCNAEHEHPSATDWRPEGRNPRACGPQGSAGHHRPAEAHAEERRPVGEVPPLAALRRHRQPLDHRHQRPPASPTRTSPPKASRRPATR